MPDGNIDSNLIDASVTYVETLKIDSDFRIYVNGYFTTASGIKGEVGRLLDNGSPDTSFNVGLSSVDDFALAPPDRIYLWGTFTTVNTETHNGLAAFSLSQAIKPLFTLNPTQVSAYPGQTVAFTALSQGSSESYAWTKDGQPLPGENDSTLTIDSVVAESAGLYSVTATNIAGSTTISASLSADGTAPTPPPVDPTPTPATPTPSPTPLTPTPSPTASSTPKSSFDFPASFSPKLETSSHGKKVTLQGTAADADGVKRVEIYFQGRRIKTTSDGNWSVVLPASAPKRIVVTVIVIDTNGNKTRRPYIVRMPGARPENP
jgi:hypothetical protein